MVFTRGTKLFELSNHLGNVLVTVSDKKIQHTTDNQTVDYYTADIASASDYYPFGMQMPGRNITGSTAYRYGFNGKEKDDEVKGEGNQLNFGDRIYDPRGGHWLSVDPLQQKYPYLSPYSAFANDPLNVIDPDGRDIIKIIKTTTFYPSRSSGLDGGSPIGGGASQSIGYTVIKAPGKDVFFYNTVTVHLSANGGNDKIVAGKPKEFFPNDFQLFGSGITQSDGMYPSHQVNDPDAISLAKLAPSGLVNYLEKKNPKQYGSLGLMSSSLVVGEAGRELAGNLLLLEGGASFLESTSVDVTKGKFAQPNHANDFSLIGQIKLGVKSIDEAVVNLKSGTWSAAKLPIDYVVRDGQVYYLNTRSIVALTEAGIPKSEWVLENRTGVKTFEDNLTNNLNGSSGYSEVTNRKTGKKTKL
jgi:RHS repeat-associated protein